MKRRWPRRRRRKERKPPWIVRLLRRRGVRLSPRAEWGLGWLETLAVAGAAAALIITFVTVRMTVPTVSMEPTIMAGDSFFVDRISYHFTQPGVGNVIVFWHLEGVQVTSVVPGSAADAAGLREGDWLVAPQIADTGVGGEPVPSLRSLRRRIEDAQGNELEATVLREGVGLVPATLEVPSDARDLSGLGINASISQVRYVKRLIATGGQTVEIRDGQVYVDGEVLEKVSHHTYWTGASGMRYGVDSTEVPENHYFVLGDNTRNSYDSRYFGFVPADDLIGAPFFRVWPLGRFGPMNGYFWSSPW
ncbi:MAG: signal peptidase I [Candidatus Bipolaricaulota bacterium]